MCNQKLNYIFYLRFLALDSMVKQDGCAEETLSAVCALGCTVICDAVCKDLPWGFHPPFLHICPSFRCFVIL